MKSILRSPVKIWAGRPPARRSVFSLCFSFGIVRAGLARRAKRELNQSITDRGTLRFGRDRLVIPDPLRRATRAPPRLSRRRYWRESEWRHGLFRRRERPQDVRHRAGAPAPDRRRARAHLAEGGYHGGSQ